MILQPPRSSWPQFIIDGVWRADEQPVWGQHWTLHEYAAVHPKPWEIPAEVTEAAARKEVTFEGSNERFLLLKIQHGDTAEQPTQVFLARIPQENVQ